MKGFQSLLAALVVSMAMVSSTATASQVDVPAEASHHHYARGHNSIRSVVHGHTRMLKAKRATQAQQEAAARAKQWSDNYAKQNSAWQAAANADLKQGKQPQDFDTWAASHGGRDGNGHDSPDSDSSESKSDDSDSSQQDDGSQNDDGDDNDDSDDDSDSDSSSASSTPSSTSSQSSPSSASSAKFSKATAAQKQAYKQDNSDKKSSSQQQKSSSGASKSSSASSSSSSSSSSGSGLLAGIKNIVSGGEVTYYSTGMGACGWTNQDSDYIVALPVGVWNRIGGTVSNGNIVCGKKLKVSNGQKAIEVEITDQCPSCADNHLDLSPAAFKALGDESKGVLPVTWGWVDGEPSK